MWVTIRLVEAAGGSTLAPIQCFYDRVREHPDGNMARLRADHGMLASTWYLLVLIVSGKRGDIFKAPEKSNL